MDSQVPDSLGRLVNFNEVFDSIRLMYGDEASSSPTTPPAKIFFYRRNDHVLTITFPEDLTIVDPMETLLIQSLLMVGNLNPSYTLFLTFSTDDFIDTELDRYNALNVTAFNVGGYYSNVYPFENNENSNEITFLDNLEKDENYLPIPDFIEEALYWSTTVRGVIGIDIVLSFLENSGCKIEFVGDENSETMISPYDIGTVGEKLSTVVDSD